MRKTKFLVVGGVNTIFGYTSGLLLYEIMNEKFSLLIILILSNIISISFSFITYKKIVFKTKDNWIIEYLKCYVVYGFAMIINIITAMILIKYFQFQYWVAQGIIIIITVIFSYYSHSNYTFAKR